MMLIYLTRLSQGKGTAEPRLTHGEDWCQQWSLYNEPKLGVLDRVDDELRIGVKGG